MRLCREDDELALGTCSVRAEAVLPLGGTLLKPTSTADKESKDKEDEEEDVDENPWHHIPHHHISK